MVLRNHRSPISIGFLLGVTFVMANWMLCIAVVSSAHASRKAADAVTCKEYSSAADSATTTFAVFLFLLYSAFGFVLGKFKEELLQEDPLDFQQGDIHSGEFSEGFVVHGGGSVSDSAI